MKKQLFIVIGVFITTTVWGQDPQPILYEFQPLLVNPAMTGVFNGNIRVASVWRDQWRWSPFGTGQQQRPFTTTALSLDANLKQDLRATHFGGVGGYLLYDNAARYLNTVQGGAALGYHHQVANYQPKFVSSGIQLGFRQRSLVTDSLKFGTYWTTGQQFDPVVAGIPPSLIHLDVDWGLSSWGRLNNNMDYAMGLGIYHLIAPQQSFVGFHQDKLYRKLVLHGNLEVPIDEAWQWRPSLLLLYQGPFREVIGGSNIRWEGEGDLNIALHLRYRHARQLLTSTQAKALFIGGQLIIDRLQISAGYSIDLSSLQPLSRNHSAWEVGVVYLTPFKKTNMKKMPCPWG